MTSTTLNRFPFCSIYEAALYLRWIVKHIKIVESKTSSTRGRQVVPWNEFCGGSKVPWRKWKDYLSLKKYCPPEHKRLMSEYIATELLRSWPGITNGDALHDSSTETDIHHELVDGLNRLPLSCVYRPIAFSRNSIQDIVLTYIRRAKLNHQLFAKEITGYLKDDPLFQGVSCEVKISTGFIGHLCSTKQTNIDRAGVPFSMFVRGFARMLERHPKRIARYVPQTSSPDFLSLATTLYQLPTWPTGKKVRYGIFLHCSSTSPKVFSPRIMELFKHVAKSTFSKSDLTSITGATPKDPSEPLKLRWEISSLSGQSIPGPQDYARQFILLIEFCRQFRHRFDTDSINVERILNGEQPISLRFGIHAGTTSLDTNHHKAMIVAPGCASTGICFSIEAHSLARAGGVRVMWGKPNRINKTNEIYYPIDGLISHLYFRPSQFLVDASEYQREEFRYVSQSNLSNTSLAFELAVWDFRQRKFSDAIERANALLEVNPNLSVAWDLMSYAYLNGPAAQEWDVDKWVETGGFYDQALRSIYRVVKDNDPGIEEYYNTAGIVHMRRAIYFLKWHNRELCNKWSENQAELLDILRGLGFQWASGADPQMIKKSSRDLLYRASLDDLYAAREFFVKGMTVSSTRSRSLFWYLQCNSIIDVFRQKRYPTAHHRKSIHQVRYQELEAVFRKAGLLSWDSTKGDLDARLQEVIDAYDRTIILESFEVQVKFAYAVMKAYYFGGGKANQKAIEYLEEAIAQAKELKKKSHRDYVMGPWLNIVKIDKFISQLERARAAVENESTCQDILFIYLGKAAEELMKYSCQT